MKPQHFTLAGVALALSGIEPTAERSKTAWQRIRAMLTPETRLEAREAIKRGKPGDADPLVEALMSKGTMTKKSAGVRASNIRQIVRAYLDLNVLADAEASFADAVKTASDALKAEKKRAAQVKMDNERDLVLAATMRENPEVNDLAEIKQIAESRIMAVNDEGIAKSAVKGLLNAYSNTVCERILTMLREAVDARVGTVGAIFGNTVAKKLYGDASTIDKDDPEKAPATERKPRRERPERRPSRAVQIDPAEYQAATETDKEPEPETEPAIVG